MPIDAEIEVGISDSVRLSKPPFLLPLRIPVTVVPRLPSSCAVPIRFDQIGEVVLVNWLVVVRIQLEPVVIGVQKQRAGVRAQAYLLYRWCLDHRKPTTRSTVTAMGLLLAEVRDPNRDRRR